MNSVLLPALLLLSALASGAVGGRLSVAIRDGGPWWLSLISALGAAGSWSWTVRAWPGALLVASLAWNVAHDLGEYGALSLRDRPAPVQLLGAALVVAGLALATRGETG